MNETPKRARRPNRPFPATVGIDDAASAELIRLAALANVKRVEAGRRRLSCREMVSRMVQTFVRRPDALEELTAA